MKKSEIVLDLNKLDMRLFYRQKMLLIGLADAVCNSGCKNLCDELYGIVGIFDAIQDKAEEAGLFEMPALDKNDENRFDDDYYNNVFQKVIAEDKKKETKA
ncbi:MAG: hypothetical protein ACIRZ1_09540 [Ligilactobacillus ruminis]